MNDFNSYSSHILQEIKTVLSDVSEQDTQSLIREISQAKTIVVCGAGRAGMAVRGFGMRLGHLGRAAHTIGDSTVPSIGAGDLFLIASGSGETQTIYDLAVRAQGNGARIALVTGSPESRIGKLAHAVVLLKAPSKTKPLPHLASIQPMTTLNEQCLMLFFDAVVLMLMAKTDETHDTMWGRHSNLE